MSIFQRERAGQACVYLLRLRVIYTKSFYDTNISNFLFCTFMEKIYICTQCNAEYDAPGICEMCDIELIPEKDDSSNDDGEKDTDRFGEFADEDDEIGDEAEEK